MVPNELSATELGYGMVKQSQINHENTYTEVGEHHGYKGEDENRIYSVLEDKNNCTKTSFILPTNFY